MPLRTTAGQLWINETLPPALRDYRRTLDKKTLSVLLERVAKEYPDQYREITYELNQIGREAAYRSGGNTFGLSALRMSNLAKQNRAQLQQQINELLDDDSITDDKQREEKLIQLVKDKLADEPQKVFEESLAEKNPIALQLVGAGRGNPTNLAGLRASLGLFADHRGKVIPVPIMRSYSQGLTPLEYYASTFGARQGILQTKMAVADAGFYGKQLNQASHRLVVTDVDGDGEPDTLRGLPTDVDDPDNEGSLLAAPSGGYERNTVLTPKVLRDLRSSGVKRLLVRSPVATGSPDGGVYARDLGIGEHGRLYQVGEAAGNIGAQAVGEPISQGMLGGKHGGGVASNRKQYGFEHLSAMIQTPKGFPGFASHARQDGTVQKIEEAPAGGWYVTIAGEQHYVHPDNPLRVKEGDTIEAGDRLSDGLSNPDEVARHKGLGQARREFLDSYGQVYRGMGKKIHRRNAERLARGLIQHVRLTQEVGDYAPDDILPYHMLEASWEPREGHRELPVTSASGRYLEKPYLHHTIGTKVRPSMLQDFRDFGIEKVLVHDEPPPFEPEMVRAMENLRHDPDWQVRQYGSYLQSGLLDAVRRGSTSDENSTSFVPSLAKSVNFGKVGPFAKTPKSTATKGLP